MRSPRQCRPGSFNVASWESILFYDNEEHADDDRHEDDLGNAAIALRKAVYGPELVGGEGGQKRPVPYRL